MDHPVRTLVYELFAAPPLRLLQRALEFSVSSAGFLSAYLFQHKGQQKHVATIPSK